jgi:hypothetical protein
LTGEERTIILSQKMWKKMSISQTCSAQEREEEEKYPHFTQVMKQAHT